MEIFTPELRELMRDGLNDTVYVDNGDIKINDDETYYNVVFHHCKIDAGYRTIFRHCRFENCEFLTDTFSDCEFNSCLFNSCQFGRVGFLRCGFDRCKFVNAAFWHTHMSRCSFIYTRLDNPNIGSIENLSLRNCNMSSTGLVVITLYPYDIILKNDKYIQIGCTTYNIIDLLLDFDKIYEESKTNPVYKDIYKKCIYFILSNRETFNSTLLKDGYDDFEAGEENYNGNNNDDDDKDNEDNM